ncbi:prephenate dehydrogenase [Aminipila sp.]|jgi:prephenate dehydrogenase|uniref:prephenate dehydrogenase n=1 Tax=Aminipila sp. TaxID=2060095 RepID=UPI001D84FDF7|nr:prephenate dehydrogenase [Aminipila sp.]MBE6035442.1 prephenate dehydrogenase [Clostridiales bacterium]
MNIGIIGLGLIGGSMAKAIKQNTPYKVFGYDRQDTIIKKAVLMGAIDEMLTEDQISSCDLLIVALYPQDAIDFVKAHANSIKKGAIVLDCCGVKRVICQALEPLAAQNGFIFMGGHPMAGLAHAGFTHAKKALFNNASMVLTPTKGTRIEEVQKIKLLCESIGFTNTQISTPEEHDRVIAFTSQLAHVVSSAYIKSPSALEHKGFSAGSYKDMTRVAKLNEAMWAELFLDNPEFLAEEIDGLIQRLSQYSKAVKENDGDTLKELLRLGKERKMIIDGEKF